ncbi:HigA family addiction module antitoxin [Cyanothece sp. BG0011]|uniref:HigA family addiction module antitoxin n=1 Tax=Cyanothece sp. BG0011 TaxID=2082950 RepID=UPI000D1EC22B|nr:HigA family addiction module antitoxin [Cyanothece sp. BG0011]
MNTVLLSNPHAGEILKYEFLDELNMSHDELVKVIHVSDLIINKIINGETPITADIDLRLCRYFQLSEGYFLRLQNDDQMMEAKLTLGESLKRIMPLAES